MRTLLSITAVLAAAGPAAADPCSVSIARAPDDVRTEIEHWVSAESRCNASLEVRVVPTDGGYYLFARDDHGRVRERVVPDARSAGVLVASWVADDGLAVTPPAPLVGPPPAPVAQPAPATEPAATAATIFVPPPTTVAISAPGMANDAPADDLRAHSSLTSPVNGRWFMLGGITDFDHNIGGRAEADILVHDGWSIAGSLAISGNRLEFRMTSPINGYDYGVLDTTDIRGIVSGAHTWRYGSWQLRLTGGVGLMYTSAQLSSLYMPSRTAKGTFPSFEGGLLGSRQVSERWAVTAGPLVTWYVQTFQDTENQSELIRRDAEITAFAGIRYRL